MENSVPSLISLATAGPAGTKGTEDMKNPGWKLCCIAVVLLSLVCFTPLVVPAHEVEPVFYGLPRTLWAGLLAYAGFVVLIFIGTRVYPDDDRDGESS